MEETNRRTDLVEKEGPIIIIMIIKAIFMMVVHINNYSPLADLFISGVLLLGIPDADYRSCIINNNTSNKYKHITFIHMSILSEKTYGVIYSVCP